MYSMYVANANCLLWKSFLVTFSCCLWENFAIVLLFWLKHEGLTKKVFHCEQFSICKSDMLRTYNFVHSWTHFNAGSRDE